MKRIYTFFMILIASILLLIFHGGELVSFWNTEIHTTGKYYQETFFRNSRMNAPGNLAELGGRLIESGPHRVVYQFARPLNAEIYIRPALVKQSSLMAHKRKLFPYKNLKSLRLRIPNQGNEHELFHVANQTSHRIQLNQWIQQAPLFELIIDHSDTYAHSERVIGSLEIFIVDKPFDNAIPSLPLFLLFLIAPVIWCWFLQYALGFSLASSLGLSAVLTLLFHILDIFQRSLSIPLLSASMFACLLILALRSWFEKRPLPTRPFFWALIWLAVRSRWQEILIHSTIPLNQQPLSDPYYQQAIVMDLFSDKGFFSASFPQSPLYPFLIKLSGTIFGFSALHMSYVSLLGGLLLLILAYRLTVQLSQSRPQAIFVMACLSLNQLLIRESGLFTPDIFSAVFLLLYLLVMFGPLKSPLLRGVLRGGILALHVWNDLAFFPLACLLILLDMTYQVLRSHHKISWKKSFISALFSGLSLVLAFSPLVIQNQRHYGSYLPESTYYISHVANIEFSDLRGFPSSLDVMMFGKKAEHYQTLGIKEYLFDYHRPLELTGAGKLGVLMIALDSMGAMLNVSTGENILGVLIHGLSSQQNLLPIVSLFILEIIMLFFLIIFAWLRFVRYRIVLLLLFLMILPHCFFYGLFMLKGFSLLQNQLDHQALLFSVSILMMMLVDAVLWSVKEHQRWLR